MSSQRGRKVQNLKRKIERRRRRLEEWQNDPAVVFETSVAAEAVASLQAEITLLEGQLRQLQSEGR